VNLHLSGEAESYINALVSRGLAANKTEAIRLVIVKCRDKERELDSEKRDIDRMNQMMMELVWNNEKDEKAGKFYERKYLRGKKK